MKKNNNKPDVKREIKDYPLKIGVISDTHIPASNSSLPAKIKKVFADVKMILHAGDILKEEIVDELNLIAETIAVNGNMDYPETKIKFPFKQVVEVGRFRIGLIHGWGPPFGIEERIKREFDNVDCIVFGHTHNPQCEKIDDILFFNPGSPTDKRFAPYNSVGILKINQQIEGEIIKL
ncbi:MAG: metallophosphoesterase family protein [Actinobacteria bacterium]|nr:metallophosphoesterase family protein [Actinomycetota bacterium]